MEVRQIGDGSKYAESERQDDDQLDNDHPPGFWWPAGRSSWPSPGGRVRRWLGRSLPRPTSLSMPSTTQVLVGGADRLELLLACQVARVQVGMVLARQLSVSRANLTWGCPWAYADGTKCLPYFDLVHWFQTLSTTRWWTPQHTTIRQRRARFRQADHNPRVHLLNPPCA